MKALTAALGELRNVAGVLRDERDEGPIGPVVVSGMLAEQLARLLADGAEPGAVLTSDTPQPAGSSVVVHVIAGDPSPVDEKLALEADRASIPIVLVQLWPQEDWARPFLLTPFVVECRAGAGFPVSEIAGRIAQAVERPAALARRIPALKDSVAGRVVSATAIRAAILSTVGSRSRAARPLITLEQLRMLSELRNLMDTKDSRESPAILGGTAASVVSAGFMFREVARHAGRVIPGPFANAAVAAGGTWLLGEAFRRLEQRLP